MTHNIISPFCLHTHTCSIIKNGGYMSHCSQLIEILWNDSHRQRFLCFWGVCVRFVLCGFFCCFFFTLSPSSLSSSWAELGGDGVVDLLPGGEGELWVAGFPFIPSWDWLIVDSWFCWLRPDWLLGPSAALIGCWLLVNRESEFTICCIWAKTGSNYQRRLLHLRGLEKVFTPFKLSFGRSHKS